MTDVNFEYLEKISSKGYKLIWCDKDQLSSYCAVEVECINCGTRRKVKQLKNIINSSKCRGCFSRQKLNINQVREICKRNGLEFLDMEYISVTHYHNFRCLKVGHQMTKPFNECLRSFKKGMVGCKKCLSEAAKKGIDYIRSKAFDLGFELLDEEYLSYPKIARKPSPLGEG